jgi:hypothetical protein
MSNAIGPLSLPEEQKLLALRIVVETIHMQ